MLCAGIVMSIAWLVHDDLLLAIRMRRAGARVQDAVRENQAGDYGRIEEVFGQLRAEWSACDMIGALHHVTIPTDSSDARGVLIVYMGSVLSDALSPCCCKDIVQLIEKHPQLEDDVIHRAQSGIECVETCLPLQALIRSHMKAEDSMLETAMFILAHLDDPVDVPLFAKVLENWMTTEENEFNEFALREAVVYLDSYGQEGHSAIRDIARRQRDRSTLRRLRDAVENSLGDDDEARSLLPEVFAE